MEKKGKVIGFIICFWAILSLISLNDSLKVKAEEHKSNRSVSRMENYDGSITERRVTYNEDGTDTITEITFDENGKEILYLTGQRWTDEEGNTIEQIHGFDADHVEYSRIEKNYKTGERLNSEYIYDDENRRQSLVTEIRNTDGSYVKEEDVSISGKETLTVNRKKANGKKIEERYDFVYKDVEIVVEGGSYTSSECAGVRLLGLQVNPASTLVTVGDQYVGVENFNRDIIEIGDKCFLGDKNIKEATLGKNIEKIGEEAFKNAKKLKKITINSSRITSIGKNAFTGISKKAVIYIKAGKKKYKEIINLIEESGVDKTTKFKRIKSK